jgi:archaellum component FlaC
MKPGLADKFKQINACLEEAREHIRKSDEQVESIGASREDLQKKVWSQSRELHILREQLEEFPELKRINDQYREMNSEFEQRLRDILSYTRALAAALQP